MDRPEHGRVNAAALGGVLRRWHRAAEHLNGALPVGGGAGALELRRTQLAYVCLLLGRGTAADVANAERLLAALITPVPGPDAARGAGAPIVPCACAPAIAEVAEAPAGPGRYAFRCEGDYWTLAGDGTLARLRGLRGFAYIAELLRHPHEPIYVVDLIAVGGPSEPRLDREQIAEHGLRLSSEADVGPMLDRRARDDYRARWRELLVEQAAAHRDNDPGRTQRAQRELEMLGAQLSAVGSGGGRNGPSFKERARVNVRNCISAALRAIRSRHNPLWRHLSNSIKTGAFCCYAPDRPIEWDM